MMMLLLVEELMCWVELMLLVEEGETSRGQLMIDNEMDVGSNHLDDTRANYH